MKNELKSKFLERWNKYFPGAALPIVFYYTDDSGNVPPPETVEGRHCFVDDLAAVRQGHSLRFDAKTVICPGGKRYLGFTQGLMPNFEYFLSCGIPGKLEGERYKKTPELVVESAQEQSRSCRRRPNSSSSSAGTAGGGGPTAGRYFLRPAGCALGPLHAHQLRRAHEQRRLLPDGSGLRDHRPVPAAGVRFRPTACRPGNVRCLRPPGCRRQMP